MQILQLVQLRTIMLKLIVLSVLAACVVASPLPDSGRVVNGTDAEPGEIPYIVSLRSSDSHMCGASILDELHILTAAHCVEDESLSVLSVQYGLTRISRDKTNVIQVVKVDIHEDYNPWFNGANDVAVLKLASPLAYSKFVQPVNLPEQGEAPPGGDTSVLAGWGRPYTGGNPMDNLQRVDLLVYTDEDCTAAHGSSFDARYHVCSGIPEGGKGQCNGDSGGPLYSQGKQIGAVSWSIKPCGIKGYPGVFARVSSYIDWVNGKREL